MRSLETVIRALAFSQASGVVTVKSRNSGVESCSLNCFMVTPHSLVTMR